MNHLHDDEVDITVDLARQLVDGQFPEYRGLPIDPVGGTGTVNRIFRLGDKLSVRLPRAPRFAVSLARERDGLSLLAGKLPLQIPRLIGSGEPTPGYPCEWAIMDWIEGTPYPLDNAPPENDTAPLLGEFVRQLQQVDTEGCPGSTRDTPLSKRDAAAREAIAQITEFEQNDLLAAWERCLDAPVWDGKPVWTHADLLPPNLLVRTGRLVAVIDFGLAGIGDPALDFGPAWTVMTDRGRDVFRSTSGATGDAWKRARGLALFQALLIIPYYRQTNPRFTVTALRTIREILTDRHF